MGAMASKKITSLTIAYSTVYSGAIKENPQWSAPLTIVLGIQFPAQRASNAEIFSIDDVIMQCVN